MKLENDRLDILGCQPSLHKLYTQICSIYSLPETSNPDQIVSTLRNGLNRLAKGFPWLAGVVVNEGVSEGTTGTFRIEPTAEIPLVVRNLRTNPTAPTMAALREASFPSTMLDENLVAPCLTLNLPGTSFGLVVDTGPVFAVQVNFISGGIILTIVGQHSVMDMTGQASIIDLLSKACYDLPFSSSELSVGNMDKSKSIPLLDDDWRLGAELDNLLTNGSPGAADSDSTSLPSSWQYVQFDKTSLHSLKAHATGTKDLRCHFVSTDDTICAFIWKCISRARKTRLAPSTTSTFARALDARQCLGLPHAYPGALMNMAYNSSSIEELHRATLGQIASQLRRQLDPSVRDLAHDTRALATFLDRCPDKNRVLITAAVDPSSGMSLSSWAKIDLYELEFNLGLGKPETVRRPRFFPVESLIYIMPKSARGETAVLLCLRDDDWARLKSDEEWSRYASHIG